MRPTTPKYSHKFIIINSYQIGMDLSLGKKTAPPSRQSSGFGEAKLYVWVKGLESKLNSLIREVDILKNDLIKKNENLRKNIKVINDDLMEVKHEQEKTTQKMDLIIKELKQTAGIEEVTTLKKYLEFWNPLNFVTQQDLDKALEMKMNPPKAEKNKKK